MPISKEMADKPSWDDMFMSSKQYDELVKKIVGSLFDIETSPLDLAGHAFASVYNHAYAYLRLDRDDGIEIEIDFCEGMPSIHFDLCEVIEDATLYDLATKEQSLVNIDKAIASLKRMRDRVENGDFE